MSSVIFQPLLHDSLGWKATNTTYADTFKWIKHRSTSKDKKISPYGQEYQRQLRKQQEELKSQQASICLPIATSEEQRSQTVTPTRKLEENRESVSRAYRCSSSKTAPASFDETPISNGENKQRSASLHREATCGSRASHRSVMASATFEEAHRPTTSTEARRSPKDDKEKSVVDSNNDNTRHWLTYPNPKTPQYLVDVKQRLGQLKVPATLARPTSASSLCVERTPKLCQPIQRSESSVSHHPQHKSAEQRHFMDFNLPETPMELRAARHRLEKHRYNPSLDNFPSRPRTCPGHVNEVIKPLTPPTLIATVTAPPVSESTDATSSVVQTTIVKDDAWAVEEQYKAEENTTNENTIPQLVIQTLDAEGLPSEYIEAIETSNKVQEEYIKCLQTNPEKKSDDVIYRLPSVPSDSKHDSFVAYRTQQQTTAPTTNTTTRSNDFGAWVRNATDKERESAMKILRDVLNQPIMGYDIPTKQKPQFKQPPAPAPARTTSATRKLGRTRTHQRIPCDVCEKQLIKNHLWSLNRSDTLICPHHGDNMKSPVVQVRAS